MAQEPRRLAVLIACAGFLLAGLIWTFARRDGSLPDDPRARRIEQYRREGNVDGLAKDLDSADTETARRAVQALGHLGKKAVKHVERAVEDPRPQVREAAAAALGRLNDQSSSALLAEVAREDESASVRASAVSALGRMYACEQVEVLFDAMEKDDDTTVRRRAYAAYYRISGVGIDFRPDASLEARREVVEELRKLWPVIKPRVVQFRRRKRKGPESPTRGD